MGHRSTARRIAVQALYQSDLAKIDIKDSIMNIIQQEVFPDKTKCFADSLANGVWANLTEIDNLISKSSIKWPIDRLNSVDKNILRLAVYELKFLASSPKAVIITEAINLAEKYSSADSAKFINGILGDIGKMC